MDERLSSLIDGELDEHELDPHLARLKRGGEARRNWDTYHLIGDALRGHLGNDLVPGVVQRLAQEPTVLAPRQMRAQGSMSAFLVRAPSVAAAVAGVSLVISLVILLGVRASQTEQQLAREKDAPPQNALATVPAPPQPVVAAAPAQPLKFDRYLLVHQRYSPSSSMQGVAPYVRTVSEARNGPMK